MRRPAPPFAALPLAVLLLTASPVHAQQKLALLIPTLFGPHGLTVDSEARLPTGQTHSAHFNSSFQGSFGPFNAALASQLASIPLPSPASGLTFTYDAALGVFNRTTQSFGPIMTDRAETLGKNRASLGFTFQRFTFDSLDGQPLAGVPAVFTHDNPGPGGRDDVITTSNTIGADLSQFVGLVSFGVTDRVDVSVAIPFVSLDLRASSVATVQRIGSAASPATHFFYTPIGDTYGTETSFDGQGRATGLGDVVFRVKAHVLGKAAHGMALGVEGRVPSGDEMDMLGSGAWGVKPFAVWSLTNPAVSPHLKLAYQWNGKTVLAGNPASNERGDLADQAFVEAGLEINLAKKVTLVVDFLGQRVFDAERLDITEFRALDNVSVYPTVSFSRTSYNVANGSVGVKANAGGNLLIDINVLFKLNDNGLRDKVTPLFGIEYSF